MVIIKELEDQDTTISVSFMQRARERAILEPPLLYKTHVLTQEPQNLRE